MGFKPSAGYGEMFSYNRSTAVADGFEVKTFSKDVLRYAIGDLVFSRVMNESRDAFGVGKGGTFTVPIAQEMGEPATVSPLTSGTAIGIGTQKMESVSMAMQEYGTGMGYEKIGNWITDIDMQTEIKKTLGNHVGRMTNWLDHNILINSTFSIEIAAAGSISTLLGTNRFRTGTDYSPAGEVSYGAVVMAYDTLRASKVAPRTGRGMYVWIANGQTLRNLKQGSVFLNARIYEGLSGLRYQVLGEFENFVFIETEELLKKGTSLVIGADAAGYGFGLLPRVWYYPDFGQDAERLEVWKTKFYRGQGAIMRDKGTACIVVRSAVTAFNYGTLL